MSAGGAGSELGKPQAPPQTSRATLACLQRCLCLCLCLGTLLAGAPLRADRPQGLSDAERTDIRRQLASVLADGDDRRDRFDAEVWLTAQDAPLRRFLRNDDERLEVLALVWTEADRHGIDPELALALIEVESSFNRYAVSSAGAQGLMQVMPFWKAELGRRDDNLTDPVTNVRYGMTILAHYLQREAGNPVRALTRYHGSMRDLSYPTRVFTAWNARWRTRDLSEVHELVTACYRARLTGCDGAD